MQSLRQVSLRETEILLNLAESRLLIKGDLVEFGCYMGDTSLLLEKMLEKNRTLKKLWLYDSFVGLPEKSQEDASVAGEQFRAGELSVSKALVIGRFKRAGLKIPIIKKGFFDQLNPEKDVPEKICFGFLDGDLYDSIKISLKLTADRVTDGGILVVHDYNNPELPGVARAVEEFLKSPTGKRTRLSQRESLAILEF